MKHFFSPTANTASLSGNIINPLQQYAPGPLDYRETPNSSNINTIRGRERTKFQPSSIKHCNIVDNPCEVSKSFPPMKYRSMSCEDARQAVNESLLNVSSMQHLLDSRRYLQI